MVARHEAHQRVRWTPDRYVWEKRRVLLPESQRRRSGAAERDTGLANADLDFSARYETVRAGEDLAREFDVPVGTALLQRTYRTRSRRERAPLSLVTSYLRHDLAAENPALLDPRNEPWPGGTQHQLHTVGIELDRITDQLTARPPTPQEREALCLAPGACVMALRKTSYDTRGRVVELSDVILPADRTEFVYTTSLPPLDA